jgi:hypothetical protein
MTCDVEMENPSTCVIDDEDAVEHTEVDCWNREEVHRSDGLPMISKEREPTIGWRGMPRSSFHPAGNGSLGDIEPEHEKLAMDSRRAPRRIFINHPEDHVSNFLRDSFPPKRAAGSGDRTPIKGESYSVPPDHSVRGHDDQGLFPIGPEPSRKNPEELIERSNSWPRMLAL